MKFTSSIAALFTVLSVFQAIGGTALPASEIVARKDYPEVIPGPGLPSLASLNITSADLFNMKPDQNSGLHSRAAQWDGYCQTYSNGYVDNTIACFNYLVSLGTRRCGVTTTVNFCTAGDAAINGRNRRGGGEVSSFCVDVAKGVQWSFERCNAAGRVGGVAPAYGNGDIEVISQGR